MVDTMEKSATEEMNKLRKYLRAEGKWDGGDAEYVSPYVMKRFADLYRDDGGEFPLDYTRAVYWYLKTAARGLIPTLTKDALKEIERDKPGDYAKGTALYEADAEERRYLRLLRWREDDLWYDGGSTAKGSMTIYHEPHSAVCTDGRTPGEELLYAIDAFKAVDHANAKIGDYDTVLRHMEIAARCGIAEAQYLMGLYCTQAAVMGGEAEHDRARYWLRKAATGGYEEARRELKRLEDVAVGRLEPGRSREETVNAAVSFIRRQLYPPVGGTLVYSAEEETASNKTFLFTYLKPATVAPEARNEKFPHAFYDTEQARGLYAAGFVDFERPIPKVYALRFRFDPGNPTSVSSFCLLPEAFKTESWQIVVKYQYEPDGEKPEDVFEFWNFQYSRNNDTITMTDHETQGKESR